MTKHSTKSRIANWLNATTTRRQVMPAYVLIVAYIFGAIWMLDFQSQRFDDERIRDEIAAEVERCAIRIEREEGLRYVLDAIYTRIELIYDVAVENVDPNEVDLSELHDSIEEGREEVANRYPVGIPGDCIFAGGSSTVVVLSTQP